MAQVIQNDQGWIIRIPDDMVKVMGVPKSSVGVLHPKAGGLDIEVLPSLDPEINESVLECCEEM
ncbi:MAG TPA: hypothetical protein VEF04_07665 [Blastocatellia bacterium]|nr:hypothetical protein [Blastocatellia bacterium]